jgi:hypothetical protein
LNKVDGVLRRAKTGGVRSFVRQAIAAANSPGSFDGQGSFFGTRTGLECATVRKLLAVPVRWVVVLAMVYAAWIMMMVTHEFGHILHAWLSGGQVSGVSVPAWGFSRTDLTENPHPLFVAWGGPIWGCLIPLGLLGVARATRRRDLRIPLFFLGFCLIANGAYLAFGSIDRAGDAGDLLRFGSRLPILIAFGAVTMSAGFYCWHRLGPGLGLR